MYFMDGCSRAFEMFMHSNPALTDTKKTAVPTVRIGNACDCALRCQPAYRSLLLFTP